jgi:type II secretory pathway component PulM
MNLWSRIFQERRMIILPLAILIVANVTVLALLVLPGERRVTSMTDRVEESRHEAALAQGALNKVRDQRTSKALAEQQLKKFYEDVLPPGAREAQDMTNFALERLARESGVTEKNGQTNYEAVKDSRLEHWTSRVVLDGPYQNIRRFLYALEMARPFVVIEKVELSPSNESGMTAGSQGNTIEVTLEISTYYLVGQQHETAGATGNAAVNR